MVEYKELIKNITEQLGFQLVELLVDEKFQKISVVIYKNTGVSVDDCKLLNDALLEDIDFIDQFKGKYGLEVSSPGLERVFKNKEEYNIFIGREVRIIADFDNIKSNTLIGILKGIDKENNILIESGYKTYKLPYQDVKKGSLYFDNKI